jgi:two-component system chemotaxis response regulator CheB
MAAKRAIEMVAMGASTGGLEALIALLEALPRDFAPAIVIVMHIPASNQNLLESVLAPHCRLPVREAEDKEAIAPGTVYLAPPGYHLLVERGGTLALSVDEPINFCRPSIDALFDSAAYAWGEALLGIVLTGANQDGARGLHAIRAAGGLAWVQDPATALAVTMPQSAIEHAGADLILTLPEMACALARLNEPR